MMWYLTNLRLRSVLCVLVVPLVHSSQQANWHFSGKNIARSRPTSQGPGTSSGGNSARAVDGNTMTNWDKGTCTATKVTRDAAFWNVTFKKPYNVSGIKIYNRDVLRDRLKNFKVFGVNTDAEDTLLYDDGPYNRYKNWFIRLEVSERHAYTGIEIRTPSRSKSEKSYTLTLCEVQVYAVNCKGFIAQNYTSYDPDKEFYAEDDSVTIRCDKGYEVSTDYRQILCRTGGWNRKIPVCQPVMCNLPKIPEFGYYLTNANNENAIDNSSLLNFNSTIIGKCNTGYEINAGSQVRVCQSDKTWSGKIFTCKQIICQLPPLILNGTYKFDNSSILPDKVRYGTILNVTCEIGFILNGVSQRKCIENSSWTGEEPVCNRITCKYPGDIRNGYYSVYSSKRYTNGTLNYLSAILVNCTTGNYLQSGSSLRRCLGSGSWSGELPVCAPIMCEWPLDLEGGYYQPSNNVTPEGLPYDTLLTAFCYEQFTLSGTYEHRRCNGQGRWNNVPAVCDPICFLSNISNGQFEEAVTDKHEVGTVQKFTCNSGYAAVDNLENVTCQKDHFWSPAPQCIPVSEREAQATVGKAGTIGGVTGMILIVLVIAAVLLLYIQKRYSGHDGGLIKQCIYCRNKGNESAYNDDMSLGNDCKPIISSKDTVSEPSEPVYSNIVSKRSDNQCETAIDIEDSDQLYANLAADEKPESAMNVEDLAGFILRSGREVYERQFKSLPKGMTEKHLTALKKENFGKNRYVNLYAYDATRVVLQIEDRKESDYINACYIEGFNESRKYIASQGPTKDMLLDFWRMIWQSKSNVIVMLTGLIEGNKIKCEKYWPGSGSSTYGRIKVKMETSEIFAHYTLRTLTIQKDNLEKRKLTQFHFTAWPDKGVPSYSSSLIQFRLKVNEAPIERTGPTIVHCSAGIGRTGTYIALDYLLEQAGTLGYVDVFGSLRTLRKQRVSLVQTLDQYILLHHALAESFMLSTKALPVSEFPEVYNKLLQPDRKKGKTKLALEFETLGKMMQLHDKQKSTGGDNTCDISILPGYKDKNAFIVTQTPEGDSRVHFWRLALDYDIRTIVMLNSRKETTVQSRYWPNEGKNVVFGNITVTTANSEDLNGHRMKTLSVQNGDVARQIKQFQCGAWQQDKTLPDSPQVILSLLELVQTWQQHTGNHTILVHCMNGVDRSGLFCVISAVTERAKIEQDVAISHVIDDMRTANRRIIPTVEQYQFCHETVFEFIQQYDTYCNTMS